MQCINCGTDNKLRERKDKNNCCKNCGHEFTFEPTEMRDFLKMTDSFFKNIIDYVSLSNSLYFTRLQLYYLVDRRLQYRERQRDKFATYLFLILSLLFSIAGIYKQEILGTVFTGSLGFILLIGYIFRQQENRRPNPKRRIIKPEEFDRYLERWIRINGTPEKLLPTVEIAPTPTAPNSEVTAYSFDRAIVCDRAEIAQLLIANNFHFEHNCAILAIDGYPQHIFNTAMEMLRRNRELKVYVLHDCSPDGIQILDRLREPQWFPDPNLPIIDVGILPRQIIDSPHFLTIQSAESASLSQQLPSKIRDRFNADELSWLDEGYGLELASLSPRKLIQILQRTISDNRQQQAIEAGDLLFIDNSPGFYTLESFG